MNAAPPAPGSSLPTEVAVDGTHTFPHAAIVQYPVILPTPLTAALQDPSDARKSPAEEEMDEEAHEWAIRIGNAPPPTWATKRKATDEGQHDVDKRPRLQ